MTHSEKPKKHAKAKEPGLIEFILSERKQLSSVLFLTVLRTVAVAPIPLATKAIVDRELQQGDPMGVLWLVVLVMGLIIAHCFIAYHGNRLMARRIPHMLLDLRARVFHKLQFMHFGFLDKTKTGRLLSKYAFDTQQIEGALLPILHTIIPAIFYACTLIVIMTILNPLLASVVILMIPVIFIIRLIFMWRIEMNNREVRIARERLTGTASEYISALRLVRSLGQEQSVNTHLASQSEGFREGRERQIFLNLNLGIVSFTATESLAIFVVGLGTVLAINGLATIGTLLAFLVALPIILAPITHITNFGQQFYLGQESYRSIRELIDSGYVEQWQGDYEFKHIRGEIVFEDVNFTYDNDKPDVLHGFNLTIEPGQHVAFVGPSGSGKSTLVSLILGLYAPSGGRILVDGMPQERIAMRAFRRSCAIVMQDSLLLSGSITDNIRFGQPDATQEQICEAARLAYAHEFIEELDKGYDTTVGEQGVSLSGGQRQRIAIARAFLRNPRILILDEATSALDYESEKQVQEALANLAEGRTVITIAHRLSTVKDADRIVVMGKGSILESGSYDELAQQDGFFAQLLASQVKS